MAVGATRKRRPSLVKLPDGGAKLRFLVADERTPRKPLRELLTDAEKAKLKNKLRRGIKL